MSNNSAFPAGQNRLPPNAGIGGMNRALNPTQPPPPASHGVERHAADDDDGWNEAKDDDEKVDWSEMPVDTPVITRRPEIGGPQTQPSIHENQDNNMPSMHLALQLGEEPNRLDNQTDDGWNSGHATVPSPPSQPFHHDRARDPPFVPAQQHSRGRPDSFQSHAGEDHSNMTMVPPAAPHHPGNSGYKGNMDSFSHMPRNLQMHRPRVFERALSGTMRNPMVPHTQDKRIPGYNDPAQILSQSEVPTYTAPIRTDQRQHLLDLNDANRVPVPNVKQWGKPATPGPASKYDDASAWATVNPPVLSSHNDHQQPQNQPRNWSEIGSPSQADWDKDARLARWAHGVPPVAPSHQPTPKTSASPSETDKGEPGEEVIARVGSVIETSPPVKLEYTEDEPEAQTPALTPHHTASPANEESEVLDPATIKAKSEKPPAVLNVEAQGTDIPTTPPSDPVNLPTGQKRSRHGRSVENSWNNNTKTHWWRRPPHPMFSPRYAQTRIFVELQCPIKTDLMKSTLTDHFAYWGSVKGAWPFEANGTQCKKGCVVFEDVESVTKVFADPQASLCAFRSAHGANPANLELKIKDSSAGNLSRTILIRLTGPRADERSHSASLRNHQNPYNNEDVNARIDTLSQHHTASLPRSIILDAVPRRGRDGQKVVWVVKIRPIDPRQHKQYLATQRMSGLEPQYIAEIDLGARVPERDIVPKICEYFAEIADIYPPTARGQGWRITLSGFQDARHLMHELQSIPGFFARWADEGDGLYTMDGPEIAPSTIAEEYVSPMQRLENEMNGRSSKPNRQWTEDAPINFNNESASPAQVSAHHQVDSNQHSATEINDTEHMVHPIPNPYEPSGHYSPNHPQLRRSLIHTYKGRPLIEDFSSGEPNYIDESAVFVGRLVKNAETGATLLKRFERYGKIASIEYNPGISTSTYTTARILYQNKESARRAIVNENNHVSFGSVLKVEPRKVLPTDVHTKEMYIDDIGRAISPSMVSQYSPPLPNVLPPSSLPTVETGYPTSHYPMNAGYPSLPPPMQFGLWYQPQPPPQMVSPYPMPVPPHPASDPNQNEVSTLNAGPSSPNVLPPLQLPMLCAAWGIGYLPPGAYLSPLYSYQHSSQHTQAFNQTQGYHVPPPAPAPPAAESTAHAPSVSASFDLPEGISSRNKMNPVAFTNEGGMFKAVYDPKDLKEYCEVNHITLPKGSELEATVKAEEVTLLPIQSGGHDPVPHQGSTTATNTIIQSSADSTERTATDNISTLPTWPSINDIPKHNNTTATRTVPIPIPFSPVEVSQPLPHISPPAPPNLYSYSKSQSMASVPNQRNTNILQHPNVFDQNQLSGSFSPGAESLHLQHQNDYELPFDQVTRLIPSSNHRDLTAHEDGKWITPSVPHLNSREGGHAHVQERFRPESQVNHTRRDTGSHRDNVGQTKDMGGW